jgi:hypothetical protein
MCYTCITVHYYELSNQILDLYSDVPHGPPHNSPTQLARLQH